MDIKVIVKYLALHKKLVGKADDEVQLSENSTIEDLLNQLILIYPSLEDARDDTTISLNGMLTDKNAILKHEDVVALFPIVSGG